MGKMTKAQVRLAKTNPDASRLIAKVSLDSGDCWQWTGTRNNKGYGALFFRGKVWRAHRVSYTIFCGEIPEGLLVCHHCDNPSCVNPSHLFLGHATTNMKDMVRKGRAKSIITSEQTHFKAGRAPRGQEASGHKISEQEAEEVIDLSTNGVRTSVIAKDRGVDRTAIQQLLRGKTWKHLKRPPRQVVHSTVPETIIRDDGVTFPSISAAARHHGVSVRAITYALADPDRRRCQGHRWAKAQLGDTP